MSGISPLGPEKMVVDISKTVQTSEVHLNVREEYVVTTEDKIRLCLGSTIALMERRNEWVAPAGILLALVGALVTADFRDFGLPKEVWRAIFLLLTAASGVWLVRALSHLTRVPSLDDVVRQLKKGSLATVVPREAGKGGDI